MQLVDVWVEGVSGRITGRVAVVDRLAESDIEAQGLIAAIRQSA